VVIVVVEIVVLVVVVVVVIVMTYSISSAKSKHIDTHLLIDLDSFVNMLLMSSTNLGKLNHGHNCDDSGSAKDLDAGIPVLKGDGAEDLILTDDMILENIDVSRIQDLNKFSLKLVLRVVMNPCLPHHFTDRFQLVPMAFLVVEATEDDHSLDSIMMANLLVPVEHHNDLLVIFI